MKFINAIDTKNHLHIEDNSTKCIIKNNVNYFSSILVDEAGNPSEALLKLLEQFDLNTSNTFKNIVDDMQKNFLREQGKERWQIIDKYQDKKNKLVPLFSELGMFHKVKSAQSHYSCALILGGLLQSVRNRLAFLVSEWERGVRFNEIVLLGSSRPLVPEKESPEKLKNKTEPILPARSDWEFEGKLPTNEIEMMSFIFDQAQLPEGLRSLKVTAVNAPNKRDKNGEERRAQTADTIITWLNEAKPVAGSLLAVSSQPNIGYQHEVVLHCLPRKFQLETIGSGRSTQNVNVGEMVDSLARWSYCVNISRMMQEN
ncbi:16475_t:CDS:1 [Racocetra persica]|uniref:16475_t:CDS:1 n=1 Tax=Racocetra persica TaxID=160502 RepID=A0ACA9NFY4_9GLOM|nr:16475_t:CDS:1 [Racocetra persica]